MDRGCIVAIALDDLTPVSFYDAMKSIMSDSRFDALRKLYSDGAITREQFLCKVVVTMVQASAAVTEADDVIAEAVGDK